MNTRERFTILLLAAAALCAEPARAQMAAASPGAQDDPAYPLYKKAYALVLRENWDEARKAFKDLASKYPGSEYRDDAEYWIAYSWRDTDADRAKKAYREFLNNYRQSSYFDDALADLDQMMARSMAMTSPTPPAAAVPPVGRAVPAPPSGRVNPASPAVPTRAPAAIAGFPDDSLFGATVRSLPAPALAPMMRMRHLGRMLRTPMPGGLYTTYDDGDVDEETKLRLEALYAVGRTGEDEKGFGALKSIAVSPKEKHVVRVAAMEELSGYRRHDVLPVFIEIARNDTSEEMQLFAIESIGSAAPDREKAFDALVKLYGSVPASKVEKRKMVFYSIAEIGNDRAVDFLADVARTGSEPELRREAVYYLGTIGGEKARTVLIDLLGGK
jgi:hypothetical protein